MFAFLEMLSQVLVKETGRSDFAERFVFVIKNKNIF